MILLLKTVTWTLMGIAVVFFWFSLRSKTDNLEYTLYALAAILLAWGSNYILKKHEKADKEG